jgi:poly(beta-D-mannuronate) lyase
MAGGKNAAMSKFLHHVLCLAGLFTLGPGMVEQAPAAALVSPVDVEARRAQFGRALPDTACPTPPAPQRDIHAPSFYSDPKHSIVDSARYAARETAMKPLHDFAEGVTRLADRWVEARPPQPAAARCALAWLDSWGSKDAMLGDISNQGGYERKWTFGGIALAYLKIRDAPGLDPAAKARVEAWFARLGAAVRRYYDRPPGRGASDRINNHLYWAALAVTAGAIATDDRAAFDWAMEKYRFALTQIENDGTLPLELARGRRALHYHLFALAPLVMLAEIGTVNGRDLYAERDGALGRLVSRVVSGLSDPADFTKRAGAAQESERLSGWSLAWAEIWHARRRDPAIVPLLRQYRPARNSWLGGDMTLSFGVPDLSPP